MEKQCTALPARLSILWLLLFVTFTTDFKLFGSSSENDVVAALGSTKEGRVLNALQYLEKQPPQSEAILSKVRELLRDPREKIRRKAARVLGILRAAVTQDDLEAIRKML